MNQLTIILPSLLAGLTGRFGAHHLQLAEDVVQEALVAIAHEHDRWIAAPGPRGENAGPFADDTLRMMANYRKPQSGLPGAVSPRANAASHR